MTENTNNNSVTYCQKKRGKENRRQSISRKRNGASITKIFSNEKHINGIVQNNKIAEAKQVFQHCKSIDFSFYFPCCKIIYVVQFPVLRFDNQLSNHAKSIINISYSNI